MQLADRQGFTTRTRARVTQQTALWMTEQQCVKKKLKGALGGGGEVHLSDPVVNSRNRFFCSSVKC